MRAAGRRRGNTPHREVDSSDWERCRGTQSYGRSSGANARSSSAEQERGSGTRARSSRVSARSRVVSRLCWQQQSRRPGGTRQGPGRKTQGRRWGRQAKATATPGRQTPKTSTTPRRARGRGTREATAGDRTVATPQRTGEGDPEKPTPALATRDTPQGEPGTREIWGGASTFTQARHHSSESTTHQVSIRPPSSRRHGLNRPIRPHRSGSRALPLLAETPCLCLGSSRVLYSCGPATIQHAT